MLKQMKRILSIILCLSLSLPLFPTQSAFATDNMVNSVNDITYGDDSGFNSGDEVRQGADFADDRVIVKVKNTMNALSDNDSYGGLEIACSERLDIPESEEGINTESVFGDDSKIMLLTLKNTGRDEVMEAVSQLSCLPNIEKAEPDFIVTADVVPNDPSYERLYGMDKIAAPQAWDENIDCSSVVVAVIDTGMDYTHPDLTANIWTNPGEIPDNGVDDDSNGYVDDVHGWNFVNNSNEVMDDNGHGTHVSGIIGAVGNNGTGVAGVAWNVKIMPIKTLNANGQGYVSDSIKAVQYANSMMVPISNNSYGGGDYSSLFADAISQGDSLFVAASGNDSSNNDYQPHYPSNYKSANILSVASTDENDQLSYFSNYGSQTVHIAAPGSNIYSTLPNNRYGYMSGTSMAAPFVTGATAVIIAQEPSLTTAEIIERIMYNSDSISGLGGKTSSGGRLNVYKGLSPVAYIPVESVSLDKEQAVIKKREALTLNAGVMPSDATNKRIEWTSSDPSVAEVSSIGTVTGIAEGTAIVKAASLYAPSVYAQCAVTVSGEMPVVEFDDMNFKQAVINHLKYRVTVPPGEDPYKYYNYTIQSDIYPDDVQMITDLSIRNCGISSLAGIEYFTSLVTLDCMDNEISSLDVSMLDLLQNLYCAYNLLTDIDFNENNDWKTFSIFNNYIDIQNGTELKRKLDIVSGKAQSFIILPQLTYIDVNSVSIGETSIEMSRRSIHTLTAEVLPADASNKKVIWSSDNTSVATVSETGVVTAKAVGTARITARSDAAPDQFDVCEVSVTTDGAVPVYFADKAFKEIAIDYLKRNDPAYDDYTVDSDIYPDDLSIIKAMVVAPAEPSDITDLSALAYFSELTELNIHYVQLDHLDLTPLTKLVSSQILGSQLGSIDVSGLPNLVGFDTHSSALKKIDITDNRNLQSLYLADNDLIQLELSGLPNLQNLVCSQNRLTALDLTGCPRLKKLICSDNQLKSLNLYDFSFLDNLDCRNNELINLKINPQNAWYILQCGNNYLDISEGSELKEALDIISSKIISTFSYLPQYEAPVPPAIEITPSFLTLTDKPFGALTAKINLEYVPDKTLVWSSSNEEAATVDSLGIVTAIARGTTVIRAALMTDPTIYAEATVVIQTSANDGDGTPDNPYKLRNTADIMTFLSNTTMGEEPETARGYLNACYILEPDNGKYIDMQGIPMTPVGYGMGSDSAGGFQGTFDGNNKEIRNITISQTIPGAYSSFVMGTGFFAYINGGTVKDLTLSGVNYTIDSEQEYASGAGSLAGSAQHGSYISNVHSSGTITGTGIVRHAGGLVGYSNYEGSFEDCSSTVDVTGEMMVGGLLGDVWGEVEITNCRASGTVRGTEMVGGFVGFNNADIFSSSAAGDVYCGTYYGGGFAGKITWGKMTDCYALGNVYGMDYVGGFLAASTGNLSGKVINCFAQGDVTGKKYVGGFVGRTDEMEIRNCYATGNVSAEEFGGGFMGIFVLGTIISNYSTGNVYSDISAGGFAGGFSAGFGSQTCENNFTVSSVEGNDKVGGFVGMYGRGVISKSYASGNVNGMTNVGGYAGYISADVTFTNDYRYEKQTVVGQTNTYGTVITHSQIVNNSFVANLLGTQFSIDAATTALHPKLYKYGTVQLVPGQPDLPIDTPSEPEFEGGDGTPENPYQVSTAQQLKRVSTYLNKCFIQINNIDLTDATSAHSWDILCGTMGFYGTYDGGGYSITGLTADFCHEDYGGLFGINYGDIKNMNIVSGTIKNAQKLGAIAGENAGVIRNCSSSLSVIVESSDIDPLTYMVGGITGSNLSQILNCCYTGGILVSDPDISVCAGGIAGKCSNAAMQCCYSIGTVDASAPIFSNVGGIAGYSTGTEFVDCYYLKDVSDRGISNIIDSPGKITAASINDMKMLKTFSGFDFEDIWEISPQRSNGFPYIKGFAIEGDDICIVNMQKTEDKYVFYIDSKNTSASDLIVATYSSGNQLLAVSQAKNECMMPNGNMRYSVEISSTDHEKTLKVFFLDPKSLQPNSEPFTVSLDK